jgi:hypothetical protein
MDKLMSELGDSGLRTEDSKMDRRRRGLCGAVLREAAIRFHQCCVGASLPYWPREKVRHFKGCGTIADG